MVLTDRQILEELIKGELIIKPLTNSKQINSSSVDIRIGPQFKYLKVVKQTHFDLTSIDKLAQETEEYSEEIILEHNTPFILHPKDFVLASTLEYLKIPGYLAARLEGRSTWGRVGLQIHSTAGLVDPGFEGCLTFELHNLGKIPLPLFPGIRIGQLVLYDVKEALILYKNQENSKYHGQLGPKNSSFYNDYDYQNIIKKLNQKYGTE